MPDKTRTIFLDTETTGFSPGQICQLSYIVQDGEQLAGKNFFFTVESMPAAARNVHGFSAPMLRKLSQGRLFQHYAGEIVRDIGNMERLVAHNAGFDCRFLTVELNRCGFQWKPGDITCTMEGMRKHCSLRDLRGRSKAPRLDELVAFLNVSSSSILAESGRLFGRADIRSHDARYDVTATFLCYQQALCRGML